MQDVWMGLIKPFVWASSSSRSPVMWAFGRRVAPGVGQGDDYAVVAGSVAVIAVDYFVTQVAHFAHL